MTWAVTIVQEFRHSVLAPWHASPYVSNERDQPASREGNPVSTEVLQNSGGCDGEENGNGRMAIAK